MGEAPIFVIDDEGPSQRRLVKILKESGHDNVQAFFTNDEALAHMGWSASNPHISSNRPAAIIADYNTCSHYNGLDMLRVAKEAGIPRMLVTANSDMLAQVMDAGGKEAALMEKPYSSDRFIDRLYGVMGNGRHR